MTISLKTLLTSVGVVITDHGALTGLSDDDHPQYHNDARGDARYAPIANGVTNGDSHDHSGGDGAQIAHTALSSVGTNTHAQIDTHLASTSNPHSTTAAQVGALATSAFSGVAKITVGTAAPGSPSVGDLWVDTN